eukprot:GILI01002149.1.p1 GENE.GILI01002149.1~~GILI01002149.1.p1  ORF type:complete len:703 (-),score=268.20 GILI01002149.1:429-2537(-)
MSSFLRQTLRLSQSLALRSGVSQAFRRTTNAGRQAMAPFRMTTSSIRPFASLATTASPINDEKVRHNLYLLGAAAVASFAAASLGSREADNCGIVGYIGDDDASEILLEGVTILQNRGYDSAGVATLDPLNNGITTTKYASVGSTSDSVDLLKKHSDAHKGHHIGIAHTRWATHGGKTDANAHPHSDMRNRIALVHNGTISNCNELKKELQQKGYVFRSETDTEVIANLIGHYLDEGAQLSDAVKKTLSRLEGTWGLAILSKDHPDQIIAARNGSPINIGIGKGKMYIASEVSAFVRHTRDYISLKDGEVCIVKANGTSLDLTRVEKTAEEKIELSPQPYPHWTIKEIMEQPMAISRALNYGGRLGMYSGKVKLGGLEANSDQLGTISHLIMAACGTSYHAALYGAHLMRLLHSFETVQVFDAAEMTGESLPPKNGGMLVLSQSGETKDVHRALQIADQVDIPKFSIVNVVGSLIARSTSCGVYLNAGRENAVASTKAFVTQVTVLALIANWFSQIHSVQQQRREELIDCLHRLPTYTGICLQTRNVCREIAEKLKDKQHCFVLGKGSAEPIAREGALKIKEITYLHAEGYSGGALKHGPFALIDGDQRTPIIMIILDDSHAPLMVTAAEEVRARGAHTIVITDKPSLVKHVADDVVPIPSNGMLTSLLAVIPLQLIAYELAVIRGIDPDKPKNLAKAVTVD